MTATSLRGRIGEPLRRNKLALLVMVVFALLLSGTDLIAPPLGIPLALLMIWLVLCCSSTWACGNGSADSRIDPLLSAVHWMCNASTC